ncbi:MAG: glycosyl hydrolase 108 family protein [Limnoraphis robusta]|uniref:Secretion activating protein n=1 Tax=Limnoraphis robusta CS-951 TaxID=1637645 RepID=A0A0F5YGN4_9CYAN|nr:glycosyl hydrolase 108 family protein [Limnoraphis robusta]KKD38031.1 secretion activating protein [Limnoraphis robusta CS-951]
MTEKLDPFLTALKFTLKWEGGAGHPQDLGGVIQYGITQATFDTYRRRQGLPLKSVVDITPSEVEQVYLEMYWKPSKADLMVLPLAVAHFDTAVNFNVKGSVEFLQEAIGGLTIDGSFGPKTQAALEQNNTFETAQRYCQARINYRYQRVQVNASQEIFLEGWLKRDRDLLRYLSQLQEDSQTQTPAPMETISGDRNSPNIVDKLEQAINLLQDVLDELKQSKVVEGKSEN